MDAPSRLFNTCWDHGGWYTFQMQSEGSVKVVAGLLTRLDVQCNDETETIARSFSGRVIPLVAICNNGWMFLAVSYMF